MDLHQGRQLQDYGMAVVIMFQGGEVEFVRICFVSTALLCDTLDATSSMLFFSTQLAQRVGKVVLF